VSRSRAGHHAAPRRGRRRLHPLAVSALVILGCVAVTYYAFDRGLPLVHRFTLHATVADRFNVRGGDPVRIAGIDVGRVVAVAPHGYGTSIELTLDPSALPVHRDATLRIRDRLFLEGSYYLELDPGTPGSPVLGDGATIPESQTSGPVQAYQLLSAFGRPTRGALVELLDALDQGLGGGSGAASTPRGVPATGEAGLKAAAPQLAPLELDVARTARALRGTAPGDVGTLLRAAAGVSGTLAQSETQLVALVRGVNRTAAALASSQGALAQTVAGIDQTLRAAPPALSAVDRALPAVDGLARALYSPLRAAPPILGALRGTVQQLATVLSPSQRGPLLASLQATFEQLPAILTQLASAFPIGRQVTDCLQTHVLPILRATVPDGSLSTGQTVLQEFLHFLPGLAGASGSFDADGPYTRYVAGAGTDTISGTIDGQSVIATGPPGGGQLEGSRPRWVGDLTPSDFRPDEPCARQALPSLGSPTASPDLTPAASPASALRPSPAWPWRPR